MPRKHEVAGSTPAVGFLDASDTALHVIPPALPHCNRCGVWLGLKRWRRGMVRCGPCVRLAGRSGVVQTTCAECGLALDPDRLYRNALCRLHFRLMRQRADRARRQRIRLAGNQEATA